MATVTLSNLQIDENPTRIGGNPNVISMSVDIIINTNDTNPQQFFYEVKNSQNEIIAMQIHPQDHKIKPNTKVIIRIPQVFRTTDGNYRLNAWSVSNWTGRRFDWGSHTGIKEWERSSNIASISKKVSQIGTGFERGAGATLQKETTQKTGGFELLPEAAAEEMLIHSRIDTSIKQNFVNMRITKNDKIQGRINFTALGFNEYFKAGQPLTNIFVIKNINGSEMGVFSESYLKFGKSETLDMIEHRDITGFSAYNQNELIIESYVETANQIVLASMITQKIVKEAPTAEPTPEEVTPEEIIDLDFNGVSTPVTTQGGKEVLISEPTEPAKPTRPAEALPIGFTGIIAGLIVLGGLFSWGDHKRRNK